MTLKDKPEEHQMKTESKVEKIEEEVENVPQNRPNS